MTNQRKIYGAILILAVSAFGVDHWFLSPDSGSPAGAQALVQPAALAVPPATPGGPAARKGSRNVAPESIGATKKAPPPPRPLATRLVEAARAERIAPDAPDGTAFVLDAFRPSSLWYPTAASAPAVSRSRQVVPPERLAEFRARHRLTAVMRSAGRQVGGLAIIGGKVYSPGQTIDGFTLSTINERAVLLTAGDASVELKIDPPDAVSSLSGAE